ncbi:MAG: nitrous oxide-stimulated promoter family protein [Desulfobulbus oligotrophicus]|nr:nitrous oxide-stimulated promoter family protein [Desulfobulbus oligotrophicus]
MKQHPVPDNQPTATHFSSRRLQREATTVKAMLSLFCTAHHGGSSQLCPQCQALLNYAYRRLQHCPFQKCKPTCGKCRIHCYAPAQGRQIREVMRFSGPRMLLSHPLLALRHFLDGLYKPQSRE